VSFDPENINAVRSGENVILSCNTSSSENVVGYRWFRRTPPTGEPFLPSQEVPLAITEGTSYVDTTTSNLSNYEYQVFGEFFSETDDNEITVKGAGGNWADSSTVATVSLSPSIQTDTIMVVGRSNNTPGPAPSGWSRVFVWKNGNFTQHMWIDSRRIVADTGPSNYTLNLSNDGTNQRWALNYWTVSKMHPNVSLSSIAHGGSALTAPSASVNYAGSLIIRIWSAISSGIIVPPSDFQADQRQGNQGTTSGHPFLTTAVASAGDSSTTGTSIATSPSTGEIYRNATLVLVPEE